MLSNGGNEALYISGDSENVATLLHYNVIITALPRLQWLLERGLVLPL